MQYALLSWPTYRVLSALGLCNERKSTRVLRLTVIVFHDTSPARLDTSHETFVSVIKLRVRLINSLQVF